MSDHHEGGDANGSGTGEETYEITGAIAKPPRPNRAELKAMGQRMVGEPLVRAGGGLALAAVIGHFVFRGFGRGKKSADD